MEQKFLMELLFIYQKKTKILASVIDQLLTRYVNSSIYPSIIIQISLPVLHVIIIKLTNVGVLW